MANPLIRKVPKMTGKTTGGHKSAGILDDHAIRKSEATKELEVQSINKSGNLATLYGKIGRASCRERG